MSNIEIVDYSPEFRGSFAEYGMYVNATRAFPDVRDGLKPVHRRILWAMWKNSAIRQGGKVKAAKAVGDTMGDYHPHGDAAIYGSMINMAQAERILVPLVRGYGNWGSLDDGAAAYRYTECSLYPASYALLGVMPDSGSTISEIDENGVEMVANYTGNLDEPIVLPALWPTYLVNGSEGIGVGVAQNAPSHNPTEIMALAARMVDGTRPRWETVHSIVPGPDVPADCDIYDTDDGGIRSYFETGQGSFVMRGRFGTEEYQLPKRQVGHRIIVVGAPEGVSAEMVTEGIRRMIDQEQLSPKITVTNVSTSDIRIILDIADLDVDDVIQRLLYHSKTSRLQRTFSVSMNAIESGQIKTVGVLDAIQYWIEHRKNVVRSRSRFRLDKSKARLHLVEGFLKAIPLAGEIVETARACANSAEAASELQRLWGFSELQANAILAMTISQITKLGADRYVAERDQLNEQIQDCTRLLTESDYLNSRLKSEMSAVAKTLQVPRRSQIVDGSPVVYRPESPAIEIPVVSGFIVKTGRNWVRWTQKPNAINQIFGSDHIVENIRVTDQNKLDGISSMGWHYRIQCGEVPGKNLVKPESMFSAMEPNERLVMVDSAVSRVPDAQLFILAESPGESPIGKLLDWDTWSSLVAGRERSVMPLDDGWEVTHAFFLKPGEEDILAISANGQALLIDPETRLTSKGRGASGNPFMSLSGESQDRVIWAGAVKQTDSIVYWTEDGKLGRFSVSDVEYGRRNGAGKSITKSGFYLANARRVPDGDDTFNWFGSFTETPETMPIADIPSGTKLTDSRMVPFPNWRASNAIWTTATAE